MLPRPGSGARARAPGFRNGKGVAWTAVGTARFRVSRGKGVGSPPPSVMRVRLSPVSRAEPPGPPCSIPALAEGTTTQSGPSALLQGPEPFGALSTARGVPVPGPGRLTSTRNNICLICSHSPTR